jgi:MFS family permease
VNSNSLFALLRTRPVLRGMVLIHSADELAAQMLNVVLGWYVYSVTRSPMSLAYLGLAQFLPKAAVLLLAGHAADRLDRRKVIAASLAIQCASLAAFAAWFATKGPSTVLLYALVSFLGPARSLAAPAMSAMLPRIVSKCEFSRAVAVNSSAFQVCAIAGPAIGGMLYAIGGTVVFASAAALYFLCLLQTRFLPNGPVAIEEQPHGQDVLAGLRYVKAHRLLFALISLDLVAVLLGGVSALLPIYAREILFVGPLGLGCLRSAPGVGAAVAGLVLAHRETAGGTGRRMLLAVAGFGLATVVLALSRNFWLSLVALAIAGGFDMVSMVIRQTLIQLSTPDAMRGRVSAANWMFIGASAELGEFESGATAALWGTMPAAALGGLGTLAVVGLWSVLFPELREAREAQPENANSADDPDGCKNAEAQAAH